MIRNYLVVALRNILKNKAHSVINVIGLSTGLAVAMLIMLDTNDDLTFDKFHRNIANTYRITGRVITEGKNDVYESAQSSLLDGPLFVNTIPEINSFMRMRSAWYDIRVNDNMISQRILNADSNFFSFFSFELLKGNPKTALTHPTNIVLTERTAKKIFGDSDILGQTLMIAVDNSLRPYVVTGLAKDPPQNSSVQFEAIVPLNEKVDLESSPLEAINGTVNTFVTIQPGTNTDDLQQKMQRAYADFTAAAIKIIHAQGFKVHFETGLQPMMDIHMATSFRAEGHGVERPGNIQSSYILIAIAVLILVIACVNFISFTIAKSAKRAKEIGVRKVIGGNRSQLIGQFLGESVLLCAVSFFMALFVAELFLPVFNELVGKQLSLSYLVNTKVIVGFISLFILTAVMSGFYPAIVMSSFRPIVVLAQKFRFNDTWFQKALVVFQFGMATILTIGTFTIYKQYDFLTRQDLGYDPANVITVRKPNLSSRDIALFRNQLTTNPEIELVSVDGGGGIDAKVNGDSDIHLNCSMVDENYVPLYGIKIVEGRNFSSVFSTDSSKAIIVNEAFVKAAGWSNPIGQTIKDWPFDGTNDRVVVGVMNDWNNAPLTQPMGPAALIPNAGPFGDGYRSFVVRIAPDSEARSLKAIEAAFRKVFPLSTFEYAFKVDNNLGYYQSEARWKKIVFVSAIMAVVISCIGLLGLTMITAEKRSKELSIRKVLGATARNIILLLSGLFLRLIVVALLIATPLAWYLANEWLAKYPYRFELDVLLFAEASALVVGIALVTTFWQSLRAALQNPINSLKSE